MTTQNTLGKKYYIQAAFVCSLAAFFYVYGFVVRTMPTGMTADLMRDFGISAAGLSVMSSMFYWGYTFMQIPAGLLCDRYGVKSILTISMGLCTLGVFIFGFSSHIYFADLAFLMIGLAASTAFVGTLVLVSRWFPPKHFAMLVGLVQFLGSVGAIVGVAPVVMLVARIGWHGTVNWFAVAGMVLTLLMLLFLRSRPNQKNVVPQRRVIKKSSMTEMQRLQIVCANPQTWWTGLYIIAIWTPVIIIALWGLPFLVARYQMDETTAAWGITLLWLGVAIGSPVIGWWSNRIHRRCMPLAVSAVFGFLSAVMVIYSDSLSWFWMCVMLFFFGIGTAGQALSFGVVRDINHTDTVGTAIGFNNMMAVIGSIFLQPIAGFILKMSWDGTMVAGAPVYSLGDYRLALLCIPISSLIALVVALFVLKETRCILQHAHTY